MGNGPLKVNPSPYGQGPKSVHTHTRNALPALYRGKQNGDVVSVRAGYGYQRRFMICMDKTIEDAVSFDELYKGLKKSCRNVRWKDSVTGYEANGLKNTYELRKSLLNGTYKISGYQHFKVHEPKEREIVATRIKDRQFQRSLCDNVLYPQVTRSFIRDNCACLRGRGVDDALNRLTVHLQRYFRKHRATGYVLKCDIRHYFAETPHEIAKAAIRKRLTDKRAAFYIDQIIDSFGGDHGIGLGSQVSQITELAVLDDLDHYIKERLRIKHYLRYMDDFILIHHDKAVLQNALKEIEKQLSALGLTLNRKTQIFPLKEGIVWLKWRFILTDTGKVIRRISRKSVVRERRKLKRMAKLVMAGRIPADAMKESFVTWKAHASRGNCRKIIADMNILYCRLTKEILQNEGKK